RGGGSEVGKDEGGDGMVRVVVAGGV
ncbi:hypothetical protein Tco_0716382, partial [Tanacetum coccineum]